MNPYQERILLSLEAKGIRMNVREDELRKLPNDGLFLLLGNRLWAGVDEEVLAYILSERSDKPVVLPEKDLLTISKIPSFYNRLIHRLSELQVAGLLLDFSGNRLKAWQSQRGQNRLAKHLLETKRTVVPLRLHLGGKPSFFPGRGRKFLEPLLGKQEPIELFVRIGSPIELSKPHAFDKPGLLRRYLRSRIYALGTPLEPSSFFRLQLPGFHREESLAPIAEAEDTARVAAEIEALHAECLLATQGSFKVLLANAEQIPFTLKEIGRLREIAFRQVGEGTGQPRDLDEYDLYYKQLIIWDEPQQRIAGGYRIGCGAEIFQEHGVGGFYIASLFKIKPGFYPYLQKSVELGRSYVATEYQRQRLPLFLLWKGILYFLLKHPEYRYLYGPMSISKYYSKLSRSIIVAYLKKYHFHTELAAFIRPRKPFRMKSKKVDLALLLDTMGDELRALDDFIEEVEEKHLRMPVLMRQYVKLNARFISFNLDPNFSDVLDGLILLDLKDVPESTLEALKKEM
jgi:putative hemolysin